MPTTLTQHKMTTPIAIPTRKLVTVATIAGWMGAIVRVPIGGVEGEVDGEVDGEVGGMLAILGKVVRGIVLGLVAL